MTSVGFTASLSFTSNLFVRDQSCTVLGKMLFQLAWNEGLHCSCLSSRAAVVVPLDLLLSYRRTKICRRNALRFPPQRRSQRRTERRSASRPDGAAPITVSEISLSVKTTSATWTCSLLLRSSTSSAPYGPNCCSSVFGESCRFSLERWRFQDPFMSTGLWRSFRRGFALECTV